MMRLVCLLLLPLADSFVLPSSVRRLPEVSRAAPRASGSEPRPRGFLKDAWAKYVLIRPEMTYDELKVRTRQPSLRKEERVPGTVRTTVIASALVLLAAIPAFLTNPLVLPRLIEVAALSRVGETPADVLEKTGSLF